MNKSLIVNANCRIQFLSCCGGKIKRKNNTICNSTKGEQVQKVRYVTLMHCDVRKKWLIHVIFQKLLIVEESHCPLKLHRIN